MRKLIQYRAYLFVIAVLAVVLAAIYGDVMYGSFSLREAMIESMACVALASAILLGIYWSRQRTPID